jgi:hypothetical protein
MQMLTQKMLLDLMRERPRPCLSLYQRTYLHHSNNAKIRFDSGTW